MLFLGYDLLTTSHFVSRIVLVEHIARTVIVKVTFGKCCMLLFSASTSDKEDTIRKD
jgi:hypothetical protein